MRLCVAVTCAAICLGGCGKPSRIAVAGTVTLDGKPLDAGYIAMSPQGDTSSPTAGAPITGGKFSVPSNAGVFAGKFRVEITASRPSGKTVHTSRGVFTNPDEQYLPVRYNSQSELTADVKSDGPNSLKFDLLSR